MKPSHKFLDALSLLPAVGKVRRRAAHTWHGNVPIQLDFALVGAQIANHILVFSDDEKAYIRGVLDYGLKPGTHQLRLLILHPLLSTLFERAHRMGKEHEAAALHHFSMPSTTKTPP
jgi:hypothetical protein